MDYPKWATAAVTAAELHEKARFERAVDDMAQALRAIGIEAKVHTDAPVILDDFVFTVERNGGNLELHVLDRITNSCWEHVLDISNGSFYKQIKISFGNWILDIMEEREAHDKNFKEVFGE